MISPPALALFAGDKALAHIRANGLNASDIAMVLAAAGGPKWLSVAALDRYLIGDWFADRKQPLHLLGTSSGAWRLACYAQNDALAAHQRFFKAYSEQRYSKKPQAAEVAAGVRQVMAQLLGDNVNGQNAQKIDGAAEIIAHPVMRYNTIAARCKGMGALENKALQGLGLGLAAVANGVSRHGLRPFVERTVFHHAEQPPISHFPHLPAAKVTLNKENIRQALLASGAIPLTISGVRNIAGARPGTYRDGGISDYQFDLPLNPDSGFVLYPHYFARKPTPGWFDKKISWRTAAREHYSKTIIVAPSWSLAESLPGGRIPDLKDFYNFEYPERLKRWQVAASECQRLADEFAEHSVKQSFDQIVQPLPW